MSAKRGRFDVMVVFSGGASVRLTSRKDKSLFPLEIVRSLRDFCDTIDAGIRAESKAKSLLKEPSQP